MRKILVFLFLASFFIIHFQVSADEGWVIKSFNSTVTIQTDGTVRTQEALNVDFNTLEKHGIYRDIPYVYQDEKGEKTYTEVRVNSVTQDGSEAKYETYLNGEYVRIKIGDANKTISASHLYVIDYITSGVLRAFPDHDELYWNVTGHNWPVSILQATATVSFPQDGLVRFTCYEGTVGTHGADCITKRINERAISVTASHPYQAAQTNPYRSGEGLTVVVGYTKGMVPILTVQKPKSFSDLFFEWPSLLIVVIGTFSGIGFVLYFWARKGRDFVSRGKHLFDPPATQAELDEALRAGSHAVETVKPLGHHETIVVEYEPPENLRPAEMGVLMDERADTLDVAATIIDLATRGFLTITEEAKKWVFGSTDYTLSKTKKDEASLLGYEKELLKRLFETGDVINVSSLKTKFYDDLAKVKEKLYEEVMSKKLFRENPEKRRTKYLLISIGVLILGVALFFQGVAARFVYAADFGVVGIVTGFLMLFFSRSMSRRSVSGSELYRRARGYALFIGNVEKYRQQFFEKKNMFNDVLAYAIVLGLTEKFAKALEGMGVKPQTSGWYYGAHPFNTATFGKSVSSFSNSFSSAIASTPSKSGGFSGGSSGGGFSGGGGGSW